MDRNFFLGLLLGASVGTILGLMYAPRPGTETREKWTELSKDAADRISKAASSVVEKAAELEETLKQAI